MVVGFCFVLVFLFVPETFWDRTPRPKGHSKSRKSTLASLSAIFRPTHHDKKAQEAFGNDGPQDMRKIVLGNLAAAAGQAPMAVSGTIAQRRQQKNVGFANGARATRRPHLDNTTGFEYHETTPQLPTPIDAFGNPKAPETSLHLQPPLAEVVHGGSLSPAPSTPASHRESWKIQPTGQGPKTPGLHSFNSPFYLSKEHAGTDYIKNEHDEVPSSVVAEPPSAMTTPVTARVGEKSSSHGRPGLQRYTTFLRTQPPKTFVQTLKPWNGRLRHENWLKVAIRPFILFAYPSILWSTLVYSLSVGWLIVLSESVAHIYRDKDTYNFSALGTGLVYLSPFIGGVLGTAVAGKVSDIIVRFMSRRNGGIYEPEFRLVMAIPVAISTCIGLMGFGWSAEERDLWIVPTVFFGIISFGCSLGSTTAITFAVDSYRQYAGEALVTMNFSKSMSSCFAFEYRNFGDIGDADCGSK